MSHVSEKSGMIARRRLLGGLAAAPVLAMVSGNSASATDDPWSHIRDRWPYAAGAPSVCVVPGVGDFVSFRFRDQIMELSRSSPDALVLNGNADYPRAIGNPFAYADTRRQTRIVLFRNSAGVVHSFYPTPAGGVGHDDLGGVATGAPTAAGDPVGYYAPSADAHHVIYRARDGHLHELNWTGVAPVTYGGNLTAAVSSPRVSGDPSAFVNGAGVNIVIYRAVNRHIMSVYWTEGPSGLDDLSGVAGTPAAIGDPFAYYTPHDNTHQVVYLGGDAHIWELYWSGDAAVVGWDLTAQAGGPPPIGKLSAYYDPGTNTKHVVYRSANGRLHELWWTPGGGTPQHVDITAAYNIPLAADRPTAYSTQGPTTQHVIYRGTDNHIYEVLW